MSRQGVLYPRLVWPMLRAVSPEVAHDRTLDALEWAQTTAVGRTFLRQIAGYIPLEPVVVAGLTFPNVLGIAAGFDKDVRVARGLGELGFGHIEVGTLTPRPQKGNPKPRIFRLPADGAVINRMGFPNGGVDTAVPRLHKLAQLERDFVVGVSLGKQKETPLADAAHDYTAVMRAVYPYADYLAVNISSPNTPGLRELQGGNYLGQLLQTLMAERDKLAEQGGGTRPLFLKIAPDIDEAELDEILQAALDHNVDGLIATNTTLSRDGLTDKKRHEAGGMSGTPLRERSTAVVAAIHTKTLGQLPIIGVGGVRTAVDVREKLDAGASLVQLYTGLIYEGPAVAGRILRGLAT